MYQGIVREVYRVRAWHPAGTVECRTRSNLRSDEAGDRWDIDGDLAVDVRDAYVGFSVGKGGQNPIRYVNLLRRVRQPRSCVLPGDGGAAPHARRRITPV